MATLEKFEVCHGEKLTRWNQFVRSLFLSGPGIIWVGIFLFIPFLVIAFTSFLTRGADGDMTWPLTVENYQRFFGFGYLGFDPLYPGIILRSLILAAVTTFISLVLGYPLTLFIASLSLRYKNLALTLVVIPLWTNLLIRTYAWQILLAPESWLAHAAAALGLISSGDALFPSTFAVCLGMVCDFLPFMVLPLYSSVEKVDWTIAEAAMDLGANGWKVFRHAILPQTMPGMVAGCILTFIPATGTFVIPDLLGGSKTILLGNAIQQQYGSSRDWPFGAAVTVLALTLVMMGLWMFIRSSSKDGEEPIL